MAQWEGELSTLWLPPDGADPSHRARLGAEYVLAMSDATGQPTTNIMPDPPLLMVYFRCDEDVLAAIEADDHCHIHWAEEIAEEVL